jgi:hypothetical protein
MCLDLVETELDFFTLRIKIFGIFESLHFIKFLKQNISSPMNSKCLCDSFLEKEWLKFKRTYVPNTFSNNVLNEQ